MALVARSLAIPAALACGACGLTADFSGLQGGALDAGSDADAKSPTFCASLATPVKLCADFDEGLSVDTGWGATDVYGGEAVRLDDVAFSAPGAFLSAVDPSGAPASARLLQAVTTQAARVHLEFEMLLTPSDGTFELAVIHEVTADGTTYGLYLREVASALQVQLRSRADDGTLYDQTWPIGPPASSWSHLEIDMDVAVSGSFVVKEDGNVVAMQTNVPTSTPSRTAMFVELGVYSFAPATARASFDDVLVDWP